MPPRKKSNELADRIRGEHLGLCVAAHLARTQLVADPLVRYDGEHLLEMVEGVARALAKVAPLYVRDANGGEPRELGAAEREGAKVQEGGNLLVLRDGRRFTSMTIKRVDLRQAIAILKATGVPELHGSVAQTQPALRKEAQPAQSPLELMAHIEALLIAPLVPQQVADANKRLVTMARRSEQGRVANLAMQVMSALQEAREDRVALLLPQLRAALEDTANSHK